MAVKRLEHNAARARSPARGEARVCFDEMGRVPDLGAETALGARRGGSLSVEAAVC